MQEHNSQYIDLAYCPHTPNVTFRNSRTGQVINTDEEVVFNYVRGQIARWEYEDWSIEYNGNVYRIDNMGQVIDWPNGLFDQNEKLCSYILKHGIFKERPNDLREELIDIDVQPEI